MHEAVLRLRLSADPPENETTFLVDVEGKRLHNKWKEGNTNHWVANRNKIRFKVFRLPHLNDCCERSPPVEGCSTWYVEAEVRFLVSFSFLLVGGLEPGFGRARASNPDPPIPATNTWAYLNLGALFEPKLLESLGGGGGRRGQLPSHWWSGAPWFGGSEEGFPFTPYKIQGARSNLFFTNPNQSEGS